MTYSQMIWSMVHQNVALQTSLGLKVELLDAADINRIVPGVNTTDIYGATYCAADGYCDPHGIASRYLKRARELGVRLQCDTEVTGFQFSNRRDLVTGVETTQGFISCETVVNAAGCWSGAIGQFAKITVPVEPVRRCIYSTGIIEEIPRDIPMTFDMDSGFISAKIWITSCSVSPTHTRSLASIAGWIGTG